MANPSVLLPEPLGPIKACTSPRLISRFTPRRIGLPSTDTCRSVIFNISVMNPLLLSSDLLVIEQGLFLFHCLIAGMMRHGHQVLERQSAGVFDRLVLTGNLVRPDLVLNSHQPFQQRFGPRRAARH